MVDAITALSVLLLVAAVVGAVVPLVPSGLLSLSGIYLYWWHSGFAEPGLVGLVAFTLLGLTVLATELFAGATSARLGGASWATSGFAAVVGVVLMFLTGPLGLLLGLFGTVFLVEYLRDGDLERSGRSAAYATVGVLASTAVQVLLTAAILLGFLLLVIL